MGSFKRHHEALNDPFDDSQFNQLFEKLYSNLCRYCLKFIQDAEVAEDIVQEQFAYVWEHRERLRNISNIEAYFFTAIKNKSLNYLKKKSATGMDMPDLEANAAKQEGLASPHELLENKELEKILENALQELPIKCRDIFVMKRFGEMSNREISTHLNISVKTVEAQMTIAIKRITQYLSTHWSLFFITFFDQFLKVF